VIFQHDHKSIEIQSELRNFRTTLHDSLVRMRALHKATYLRIFDHSSIHYRISYQHIVLWLPLFHKSKKERVPYEYMESMGRHDKYPHMDEGNGRLLAWSKSDRMNEAVNQELSEDLSPSRTSTYNRSEPFLLVDYTPGLY
jgi:hypothetical protein